MDEKRLPGEEWRPIDGWPYEVSSLGRVRRPYDRYGRATGRVKAPTQQGPRRYLQVWLLDGGRKSFCFIHRLVAGAFLGVAPAAGRQVNHKNGDRLDNRAVNLEWVTPRENAKHAVEHGLMPLGERRAHAKLVPGQVVAMREKYRAGRADMPTLAAEYGVATQTVCKIINRQKWAHLP